MNDFARFSPYVAVGLALCYLGSVLLPPSEPPGQMQIHQFAKLPVVDRGRVKPMDTMARTALMVISNRQTFTDSDDKSQPAVRWLLDVMTSNALFRKDTAEKLKVFRIENDQVLNLLGLEPRPGSYRYSVEEFGDKYGKLKDAAVHAEDLDPKQRDKFNQKVLELFQHVEMYRAMNRLRLPLMVPPRSSNVDEDWQPLGGALLDAIQNGREDPSARSLAMLLSAYADQKPEAFNRALADYRQALEKQMPDVVAKADFETFFNDFAPFYHCSVLYVLVFVFCCLGWVGYSTSFNRAAFWLAVVTLVVQTWALAARMYIQGRPPVTNLYSSAVFIGWGGLLLTLTLEAIYRNGLGTLVAAVLGSLTMLIAHHLAGSGDTLEMMQAVLDTNFWLATHVTCVTLGYTATFVAGLLGVLYVLLGVFTREDNDLLKSLSQMIYGVVCFATLLSFTGTVLGGIWADQSWGRFWGWDPKENGAVLIVIWNALILHARWAGMVKQRGMAVLAIIGNMITGWSWFGTNQLGVGLHAYGFNNTLATGLTIFWVSQLACIAMGLLPLRYWKSFADQNQERRPPMNKSPRGLHDAPVMAGAK